MTNFFLRVRDALLYIAQYLEHEESLYTKNSKAAVCSFYEAVERTCIGTCKNDHRSY